MHACAIGTVNTNSAGRIVAISASTASIVTTYGFGSVTGATNFAGASPMGGTGTIATIPAWYPTAWAALSTTLQKY